MKIAIGLSGGVDSAVAAALLKQQGHEVIGITMKLWKPGRYAGGPKDACFGPGENDDISRAAALCEQLGVPYYVFDCSDEYENVVLEYFRNEYLTGHTPNPCVRCNAFMKFGVLPNLAKKSGLEFDWFATGHYAQIREKNGVFHLLKGMDENKDQSYFLYRLNQKQLSTLCFPLGCLRKMQVRELARKFDLAVKDKPDSQDFYSGDHTELLRTPDRAGNIVDAAGKILGIHRGFWHYTIGQRKGLGIAARHPLYVLELNACRNEVVVGAEEDAVSHTLELSDCHWISALPSGDAEVQIRSASRPAPCRIDGSKVLIPGGVLAAAKGQSAVLYRAGEVLGGGIIVAYGKKMAEAFPPGASAVAAAAGQCRGCPQ